VNEWIYKHRGRKTYWDEDDDDVESYS